MKRSRGNADEIENAALGELVDPVFSAEEIQNLQETNPEFREMSLMFSAILKDIQIYIERLEEQRKNQTANQIKGLKAERNEAQKANKRLRSELEEMQDVVESFKNRDIVEMLRFVLEQAYGDEDLKEEYDGIVSILEKHGIKVTPPQIIESSEGDETKKVDVPQSTISGDHGGNTSNTVTSNEQVSSVKNTTDSSAFASKPFSFDTSNLGFATQEAPSRETNALNVKRGDGNPLGLASTEKPILTKSDDANKEFVDKPASNTFPFAPGNLDKSSTSTLQPNPFAKPSDSSTVFASTKSEVAPKDTSSTMPQASSFFAAPNEASKNQFQDKNPFTSAFQSRNAPDSGFLKPNAVKEAGSSPFSFSKGLSTGVTGGIQPVVNIQASKDTTSSIVPAQSTPKSVLNSFVSTTEKKDSAENVSILAPSKDGSASNVFAASGSLLTEVKNDTEPANIGDKAFSFGLNSSIDTARTAVTADSKNPFVQSAHALSDKKDSETVNIGNNPFSVKGSNPFVINTLPSSGTDISTNNISCTQGPTFGQASDNPGSSLLTSAAKPAPSFSLPSESKVPSANSNPFMLSKPATSNESSNNIFGFGLNTTKPDANAEAKPQGKEEKPQSPFSIITGSIANPESKIVNPPLSKAASSAENNPFSMPNTQSFKTNEDGKAAFALPSSSKPALSQAASEEESKKSNPFSLGSTQGLSAGSGNVSSPFTSGSTSAVQNNPFAFSMLDSGSKGAASNPFAPMNEQVKSTKDSNPFGLQGNPFAASFVKTPGDVKNANNPFETVFSQASSQAFSSSGSPDGATPSKINPFQTSS